MKLEKDDIILFNGDSITDNNRDRNDEFSLSGYNQIINTILKTLHMDLNLKIYNRGVGGDTTAMLLNRLEKELIEIKPTVLSILIGFNDSYKKFEIGKETTILDFEKNVFSILELASKYLKKIIIIEPYILNSDGEKTDWRNDLNPKIQVLRKYAELYKTDYIALDGIFAELQIKNGAINYSYDGVHPTHLGHLQIAKEWMKKMEF